MTVNKKIRVLVGEAGLDGHNRDALVIAQALREEGVEVVDAGLRQTPAQIVKAAIQEDVDCIGLSCLSGAHNELLPEVVRLLREENATDIIVIGAGAIPQEDIPFLESQGITKIFDRGTPTKATADYIKKIVQGKNKSLTQPPDKIAHIGIAVKSIETALPFYTQQLGLALVGTEEVESEQVRVAFLAIGESRFELLEPLSEDSPIAKFIAKRGEGIHHIALDVDDVAQRLGNLKAAGVPLIHENPKPGAHGAQIAFLHPKASQGVLYELCQYPKANEEEHQ